MKFLFDFFPVLIFFIAYKFFGDLPASWIDVVNQIPGIALSQNDSKHAILFATLVIILATVLQNLLHYAVYRRLERMHLIAMILLLAFGSLTLIFRDSAFIQWKVTILNWLFALVFMGSEWFGQGKPLIQHMMGHALQAPDSVWKKVNRLWVGFFLFIGALNLFVAYRFSEAIWVDFKLFGILGLTIVFVIAQAFYLQKHMSEATNGDS